jgi:hypothetical protein
MYEGAHRAFINSTVKHSRDDANDVRKAATTSYQYCRKRLRHSRFRNSRVRRSALRRCRRASSAPPEDGLRGL